MYSDAQWQSEMGVIFSGRSPPPVCLDCRRSGFCGPRDAGGTRRYRLCKFCGHYEQVGSLPVRCQPSVHACAPWPKIAGAHYIWWVQPAETTFECPYCHQQVAVAQTLVARPCDDPKHPWWAVPQGISFEQAAAYWAQQGQGRVYL